MAKKVLEKKSEAVAAPTQAPASTPITGKFFIKKAKDGSYMFNLRASNGETIATSDMYSSLEKCKKGITSVQMNAPIANIEDHTVSGAIDEVVNPKYEMYYDKSGDYRFRLKAKNGSIIVKSQGYSSKSNCVAGIESVRKNAEIAKLENRTEEDFVAVTNPKFEMYQDKAGEYRFRLRARNGEVIAASEGYVAKASCLNGIDSVRKNAIDAEVI